MSRRLCAWSSPFTGNVPADATAHLGTGMATISRETTTISCCATSAKSTTANLNGPSRTLSEPGCAPAFCFPLGYIMVGYVMVPSARLPACTTCAAVAVASPPARVAALTNVQYHQHGTWRSADPGFARDIIVGPSANNRPSTGRAPVRSCAVDRANAVSGSGC